VCGNYRVDQCSTNDVERLLAVFRSESKIDALVIRKADFEFSRTLPSDLVVHSTKNFFLVLKTRRAETELPRYLNSKP
jgi:hypothetical protein